MTQLSWIQVAQIGMLIFMVGLAGIVLGLREWCRLLSRYVRCLDQRIEWLENKNKREEGLKP